jgi:hypothetical protein
MDHWSEPKSLKELFDTYPDELDEYVNDYKIHVFEIAWFTDEQISKFTGDFRIVVNFFAKKRRSNGNYIPDDSQEIKHVDAVLKLLSVVTGDDSYSNLKLPEGRKKISMCDVAQNLINQGFTEGEAKGYKNGEIDGGNKMLYTLVQDGSLTVEVAAKKMGVPEEEFINKMNICGYKLPEA